MRLGTKLTIAFGAVTLLPLAPLALVGRQVIANSYRQELHRSLEEAAQQTERAYDEAAKSVEWTCARLARSDDPMIIGLKRALAEAATTGALSDDVRSQLSDEASREARARGLDLFTIVTEEGLVLASPADPGREGTRDPALVERLRGGGARARVVEEHPRFVKKGAGRLAIEVSRQLASDGGWRGPWLVGGVWLDEALPDRDNEAVERHVRPTSSAPLGAVVRRVELDGGPDQPTIAVELWATDRTLRATLADLTLATVLLAIGGAALALLVGARVARRITEPLDDLALGAESVARGRRDLSLPVVGNDEVAALTKRFNEMVAALGGAEEQAVRAERVAAWREMAQHLAHELKNPLTPIQMSIETLQRTRARPDRAADFDRLFDESAHVILDEVARLKSIVGEFSRFARLPSPTFASVDLRELCEAATRLYEGAVRVELDLPADLPRARADRDQLQQVLVNLLENAREAVAATPSPRIVIRGSQAADRVVLEVIDDGPGIDPAVRARLFQPYVTGKPGGTGLGLALVQRIVTEHGGRVTAEDVSNGACFRVELPSG